MIDLIAFPKRGKKPKKRKTTQSADCKAYADKSRELGCIVSLDKNIQMHHLEGREFHFKKVHVGHFWQIPLWVEYHDVGSNHPLNVTHHKEKFHDWFGRPNVLLRENAERCRDAGIDYPEQMLDLADEYYQVHEDSSDRWMAAFQEND